MSENYRRQDYDQYSFCIKETVRYVWEGILLVAVISYFFYRSIIIGFLLSPLILVPSIQSCDSSSYYNMVNISGSPSVIRMVFS